MTVAEGARIVTRIERSLAENIEGEWQSGDEVLILGLPRQIREFRNWLANSANTGE